MPKKNSIERRQGMKNSLGGIIIVYRCRTAGKSHRTPHSATKAQTHTDRRRAPERVKERHQERRQNARRMAASAGIEKQTTDDRRRKADPANDRKPEQRNRSGRFYFCVKYDKTLLFIVTK